MEEDWEGKDSHLINIKKRKYTLLPSFHFPGINIHVSYPTCPEIQYPPSVFWYEHRQRQQIDNMYVQKTLPCPRGKDPEEIRRSRGPSWWVSDFRGL